MGRSADTLIHFYRYGTWLTSSPVTVVRWHSKLRQIHEAAVYKCISLLARSVGQAITRYMHDLLDLMFAGGLNEPLREALIDIGRYIPPLLAAIQDRLLNMLSMILSGQPYRQPGAPAPRNANPVGIPLRDPKVSITIVYR